MSWTSGFSVTLHLVYIDFDYGLHISLLGGSREFAKEITIIFAYNPSRLPG
jgi:hypothetical protein